VEVIDCRERAVVWLWRKGHLPRTIRHLPPVVRRFRTYCDKSKLPERTSGLLLGGARRFAKAYAGLA